MLKTTSFFWFGAQGFVEDRSEEASVGESMPLHIMAKVALETPDASGSDVL